MWAGPLCTELLGRAGAEVSKVTSAARPDGLTGSPMYAELNEHKTVIDLDLRHPADRHGLGSLLASADLMVTSLSPRALANLDLLPAQLGNVHPQLRTLAITAFEAESPEADWVAYGTGVHAASGLGWLDDEPRVPAYSYPDPLAGLMATSVAVGQLAGRGPRHRRVSLAGAVAPPGSAGVLRQRPGHLRLPLPGPAVTVMAERVRLVLGDDGVATITLCHPPLNIYDLEMRDGLIEAITAVRDVPDVRCVVLAAEGKHFSAGADLSEFGTAESIFDARRIRWDRDPWLPLLNLPVPTPVRPARLRARLGPRDVVVVRSAHRQRRRGSWAFLKPQLGMLPAAGGTQSLTAAIGPTAALPLVLSGRNIDALEALRLGIVAEVAPTDDLNSRTAELAGQLARIGQADGAGTTPLSTRRKRPAA